ncbi:hypothetical protein ABKN59_008183 [Abortiporus biennis]
MMALAWGYTILSMSAVIYSKMKARVIIIEFVVSMIISVNHSYWSMISYLLHDEGGVLAEYSFSRKVPNDLLVPFSEVLIRCVTPIKAQSSRLAFYHWRGCHDVHRIQKIGCWLHTMRYHPQLSTEDRSESWTVRIKRGAEQRGCTRCKLYPTQTVGKHGAWWFKMTILTGRSSDDERQQYCMGYTCSTLPCAIRASLYQQGRQGTPSCLVLNDGLSDLRQGTRRASLNNHLFTTSGFFTYLLIFFFGNCTHGVIPSFDTLKEETSNSTSSSRISSSVSFYGNSSP